MNSNDTKHNIAAIKNAWKQRSIDSPPLDRFWLSAAIRRIDYHQSQTIINRQQLAFGLAFSLIVSVGYLIVSNMLLSSVYSQDLVSSYAFNSNFFDFL